MNINANTLISNIFQPNPAPNKASGIDAIAEKFASIEPGGTPESVKIAGISTDDPNVKQIDLSQMPFFNISEASEDVYRTYITAEERMLKTQHAIIPDISQNPRYDKYAEVILDDEVVVKFDNHGATATINPLGAKVINLLKEVDDEGLSGPALAQARAQHIAEALGGEVRIADTALNQQQFHAIAPAALQFDTTAMQQDARYEQLQRTKQARTEFITQQIAQENAETGAGEAAEENTAAQDFLDYMNKSSAELWRERILESLGLTEESLAALPPEDRRAAEEKIARITEEKIKEEANKAEQENGKTKEMLDVEKQEHSPTQATGQSAPLNNDLSGLQNADPKITQMIGLAPETLKAYTNAQQKVEAQEPTKHDSKSEQKI